MTDEQVFCIQMQSHGLLAVLHGTPERQGDLGVLVVVGGPQYRVGSHRQFVLLARHLAAGGFPVMRFDYSGMGDSDGPVRSFEEVSEDIRAAIDAFTTRNPGTRRVVLWGLCDGASAALMYAPGDPRVAGLLLLNPWVRTAAGLARSHLWTYYPRRLLSGEFWRKVLRRPTTILRSAAGLAETVRVSQPSLAVDRTPAVAAGNDGGYFIQRMIESADRFARPVAVLLSGNDITAGEFKALLATDRRWRRAFSRATVAVDELPDANHTFSSAIWRNWVAGKSLDFVRAL